MRLPEVSQGCVDLSSRLACWRRQVCARSVPLLPALGHVVLSLSSGRPATLRSRKLRSCAPAWGCCVSLAMLSQEMEGSVADGRLSKSGCRRSAAAASRSQLLRAGRSSRSSSQWSLRGSLPAVLLSASTSVAACEATVASEGDPQSGRRCAAMPVDTCEAGQAWRGCRCHTQKCRQLSARRW